jgi:taurine dioxygenase
MAELRIRRLGYALGAQVTGVDLARPISDDMVAEIRRAWNQHIMLCFPGQNLDAAQMASACRRFGELDDNRHSPELRHPSHPDVMNVVNKPTARVGGRPAVNVTADLWHTDFSHHERPTLISLLLAKVLPDVGGDTMFANMYMAYDALSNTFKGLIDPLSAVHDYSLGPLYAKSSPEQQAKSKLLNPPVIHPLVRTHPETGRRALYLSSKIRYFVGMTENESRPLIDFLYVHATTPPFVYRHRWTVDDFALWDNRCSMHAAIGDYDKSQTRSMLRCSLLGPKCGKIVCDMSDSSPTVL